MVSVVNIRRQEAGESLSLPPLKPPQNNWTLSGPPKSQRYCMFDVVGGGVSAARDMGYCDCSVPVDSLIQLLRGTTFNLSLSRYRTAEDPLFSTTNASGAS